MRRIEEKSVDPDRIAGILRDNRNWTNWPSINEISWEMADAMGLNLDDKAVFLQRAGALDRTQRTRKEP